MAHKDALSTRRVLIIAAGTLLCFGVALFFRRRPTGIQFASHHPPNRISDSSPDVKAGHLEHYGQLPLIFEVNSGQSPEQVDFLARGHGYTLLLAPTEARLSSHLPQSTGEERERPSGAPSPIASGGVNTNPKLLTLSMKLVGANSHAAKKGLDELPGKVNYFLGNDSAKWRSNVATYAKVEYQGVYPGIDLVYRGDQRELEYDFVVAPGANPSVISLDFQGADELDVDAQGDLVIQTAVGRILQLRQPLVYQEVAGARQRIPAVYIFNNNRVSFRIAAYDTAKALVIDPVFAYSTRLGGSDDDAGYAIAVDAGGNAYVTGDTESLDFPCAKPLQRASGGSTDVFVAKLSADGSTLLYSTYLGGSGADVGYGIALDPAGNIYLTGDTSSTDFPVVKPMQPALAGAPDVFVSKLSADGSRLLYSTYIGGSNGERGNGIAVDADGSAYVTGYTNSKDFPTANPLQAAFAGGNADAFVLKINPSGSALVYSTYLGGGNDRPDIGTSVAVDSSGDAYVTGFTNSRDFPTVKPLQAFVGPTDVFVAKLNPSGSALIYSTHLGGTADDEGMGIAVDALGNAYITGETESPNFPTTPGALSTHCLAVPFNAPIGNICSGGDAFVTKISPDGSALVYSTYLNGSGFEVGRSIAVDSGGNAYVTGLTGSTDFPNVNAVQTAFGGGNFGDFDAFVVKLNPTGSALIYSTYLGGKGDDGGYGIAVDGVGSAYVVGRTGSPDFPVRTRLRHNPRRSAPDARDAFVTKIANEVSHR